MYISCKGNTEHIVKLDLSTNMLKTIAGGGSSSTVTTKTPNDLNISSNYGGFEIDTNGDVLFCDGVTIRKIKYL